MIFISHRGNLYGPNPKLENTERLIEEALSENYFVEIDIWKLNDSWWLGHDGPENETSEDFIKQPRLLLHAKNLEAFKAMIDLELHCFWHQEDHYALTSRGLIISYPGYATGRDVICMKPELSSMDTISKSYAICSDYVAMFRGVTNKEQGERSENNSRGNSFNDTR